jgi:hypothetical protein
MKNGSTAALLTVLLGGIALSNPAHAQWGTATNPMSVAGSTTKIGQTSVSIYPATPFTISAPRYQSTLVGTLIAADYSFVKGQHSAFTIGGWVWARDGADIEELHAKYYFGRDWGIQAGLLGSSHGGGTPSDYFLNYHFALGKASDARAVQILTGAGIFVDPSGSTTTAGFSGFLQAQAPIGKNLTLNLSYWYLNDKGIDGHRYGLGIGTRF